MIREISGLIVSRYLFLMTGQFLVHKSHPEHLLLSIIG